MSDKPKPLGNRYFAKLAGMLPGLKAQAGKIKQKAFVSNVERKAHEPIACPICGASYDGFNGFAAKKKPHCPDCQARFDKGLICLVTMDGKRFAFVDFPHADSNIRKLAMGKIFNVSNERMDEVESATKALDCSCGGEGQIACLDGSHPEIGPETYAVKCEDCDNTGPIKPTQGQAILAWNWKIKNPPKAENN